jgi:outer membrane lipopolysaccharide assembly protein LptE/RlpB
MDSRDQDRVRAELDRLLRQQVELLKSRAAGTAAETEILEYELKREVIQDLCKRLANSSAS